MDGARVNVFENNVQDAWRKHRFAARLFESAAAFQNIDGDNRSARFGFRVYVPKDWYVGDRIAGMEGHAQQIGNQIAEGENKKFQMFIAAARPLRRASGDVNRRLERAIETMRGYGYEPTMIFVSWRRWWLPSDLHLHPLAVSQDDTVGREMTLGSFNGLRIIGGVDLPDDKAVVVDLRAFATWRQWTREGKALDINVTTYNEEAAMALVRADTKLLRAPGRTRLLDRARELRKHALVEVSEDFTVNINDPGAARAVLFPASLFSL